MSAARPARGCLVKYRPPQAEAALRLRAWGSLGWVARLPTQDTACRTRFFDLILCAQEMAGRVVQREVWRVQTAYPQTRGEKATILLGEWRGEKTTLSREEAGAFAQR